MNEQIRHLKNKVLDDHFSFTWTSMDYYDIEKFSEKFAELIVKECMSVCIDDIADPRDTTELKCAKKIKEHFGVKE